jgi:hypothetical protein
METALASIVAAAAQPPAGELTVEVTLPAGSPEETLQRELPAETVPVVGQALAKGIIHSLFCR